MFFGNEMGNYQNGEIYPLKFSMFVRKGNLAFVENQCTITKV
jgi:hypothetical protein